MTAGSRRLGPIRNQLTCIMHFQCDTLMEMKQVAIKQRLASSGEPPIQAPMAGKTESERSLRVGLHLTLLSFGLCAIVLTLWLLVHSLPEWTTEPRTSLVMACCLALLSIIGRNAALSTQGRGHPLTRASRIAALTATSAFALLVLWLYAAKAPDAGSPFGPDWGVMAPGTAIVVLLIAIALLALEIGQDKIAVFAATSCLIICELALAGHLLDQTAMRETIFFGYMGPLTAAMAGIVAIAVLCVAPAGNWLSDMIGGGRRAALRARLIAYAVGLPILVQACVSLLVAHHDLPVSIGRSIVAVLVGIALAREILRASQLSLRSQELSARLGAIVESSDDAIIGKDLEGRITSWNRGAERLFGYSEKGILGQTLDKLIPRDRPEEEPYILAQIRHGRRLQSYVTQRVRKDGVKLEVSITVSPIHDADGTIIGVSSIYRDVTALMRINEQLRRSNEELAQFAYVASHDMREPLRMMANYAELLEEHCGTTLDATAHKYLEHISQGALRMQQLISDLLTYSRVEPQGRPLLPVPVEPIVQRIADLFADPLAECGGELRSGELPTVLGDHEQLFQVFQNLVDNAIKFRSERPLRISMDAKKSGDDWTFRVSDNGIGFEPDHADKIFDMFQRLHSRKLFPGSGIGLTIVKRIIERHEGKIWISSRPNEGTEVFFTLKGAN